MVASTGNPGPTTARDDADLAQRGSRLADAVAAALPGWVERSLRQRASVAAEEAVSRDVAPDRAEGKVVSGGGLVGGAVPDELVAAVTAEVEAEVLPRLRALLAQDVDEQRQSPLAVVRRATATVGGALDAMGVPAAERDEHQRSLFPNDDHDLVPATFAELSEDAGRAGIEWGAAKAFVHRRRHRG